MQKLNFVPPSLADKKTHNAVGNGNVLQYETTEEAAAAAAEVTPQVEKAPKGKC